MFLNRQLYWRCTPVIVSCYWCKAPFRELQRTLLDYRATKGSYEKRFCIINQDFASFFSETFVHHFFYVHFSLSFIVYLHFVVEYRICFCKIFSQIIFNENFFFTRIVFSYLVTSSFVPILLVICVFRLVQLIVKWIYTFMIYFVSIFANFSERLWSTISYVVIWHQLRSGIKTTLDFPVNLDAFQLFFCFTLEFARLPECIVLHDRQI